MKLYKVTAQSNRDDTPVSEIVWVGSQADAAKARKSFIEQGFKRAKLDTEEVDVPTNKEGLLNFLNSLEN